MPQNPILDPFQDPTSTRTLLINLGLVLILGQVLVWHYLRFSPVLSNKRKFARTFVFVAATTMLVISVVKSSLALSLGLVGALSIIRFRTPIKEPEELAYLFLSIGLGLGLGANQRMVTVVIFAVILGYMALISLGRSGATPPRILVHVSGDYSGNGASVETTLREVMSTADEGARRVDLRRIDTEGSNFQATLVLDLERTEEVGPLLSRLQKVLPRSTISVVEASSLD